MLWEICRRTLMTNTGYWPLSHCISAQMLHGVRDNSIKCNPFTVGVGFQQGYAWAQFCCKLWWDSLVWNQYITKPEEKNVGGHAILYSHSLKKWGNAAPCSQHLALAIFVCLLYMRKSRWRVKQKPLGKIFRKYKVRFTCCDSAVTILIYDC